MDRMIVSERDWANTIPADVLHVILDKLLEPRDHANFAAVCSDWHLAWKEYYLRIQPLLPMLMIPIGRYDHDRDLYSRIKENLYSISTEKIYDIPKFSVPDKARYCGSSHGWLATVENERTIVLVNPFKNALAILLPPIDFVPDVDDFVPADGFFGRGYDHIYKVILTADPISNPDSYVVLAIYGARKRLAFYQSKTKLWAYLDKSHDGIYDVVMYKGLAYAIKEYGNEIISFDVNSLSEPWELKQFKTRWSMVPCRYKLDYDMHYLMVTSQGELLQVHRSIDDWRETESFSVFKLRLAPKKGIFYRVTVDHLGNKAIFLSDNYCFALVSMSTPVRKFYGGCAIEFLGLHESNTIYYNYFSHYQQEVGRFYFDSKRLERYDEYHPICPLWVTPSLLNEFKELASFTSDQL